MSGRIWKIGCIFGSGTRGRKEILDYFQRENVISLAQGTRGEKEFKNKARLGELVVVYSGGEIFKVGEIVSGCRPDRKFWEGGGYLRKVRWVQPFIRVSVKDGGLHSYIASRQMTFLELPHDCVSQLVKLLKKRGVNLLALTRQKIRKRVLEPPIQKLRQYQSRKVSTYNRKIKRYSRDNTLLEKSSKGHQKILNRLARVLRQQGLKLEDSEHIDLTCKTRGVRYLFEVKSCRSDNVVSQIRRGIAQLYEYRFLMLDEERKFKLFLVLEIEPPKQPIDFLKYLEDDRSIGVVWVKNQKLVCTNRTAKMLSPITMEEVELPDV